MKKNNMAKIMESASECQRIFLTALFNPITFVCVAVIISVSASALFENSSTINENYKIEHYSGGKVVNTWVTDGSFSNAGYGNAIKFQDAETSLPVIVHSGFVITPIPKSSDK